MASNINQESEILKTLRTKSVLLLSANVDLEKAKTVAYILQQWPGSVICHDEDLKNYYNFNNAPNQECHVWDLVGNHESTVSYNPLDWLSARPNIRADELMEIVDIMVDKKIGNYILNTP